FALGRNGGTGAAVPRHHCGRKSVAAVRLTLPAETFGVFRVFPSQLPPKTLFRYCQTAKRDRMAVPVQRIIGAPMPLSPARRLSLFVAAMTGGVMVAMIVEIMLARRGVEFTGALRGLLGGGSVRMHAALAWWAITGVAFVASFAIAVVMSRVSWLYFRSLR